MNEELIKGAETVSMFCRRIINTKKDLPIRSSQMGLLILICKSENPATPVMAADFFNLIKLIEKANSVLLEEKNNG